MFGCAEMLQSISWKLLTCISSILKVGFFFFNLNILICIISCIGFTKQELVKIESKHSI